MQTEILVAPPQWRCIDFISDLHLQTNTPATAKAWFDYMAKPTKDGITADAIFILGDWFEVWVGDDDDHPFASLCAAVMRARAKFSTLFLMHGNRDFLIGTDFADRCSATLLPDPTRLEFNGSSYLLSHGDLLCTDDAAYMRFRNIVRSEDWQAEFLAKPLPERRVIAQKIRTESRAAHSKQPIYADINDTLALEWLATHGCDELIHGHTHQPASHPLAYGMRHVLSDWDADTTPPRQEVLRLTTDGLSRIQL
jgi:UDP-2,3-diacylglucosamine hydrolase